MNKFFDKKSTMPEIDKRITKAENQCAKIKMNQEMQSSVRI